MANTVGAKPKSYEDYVNNTELTDKQEEFVLWLGKIGVDLDAYDEEAMDAFRRGLYLAWALRSRFQEHNRSVKEDESDEVPLPKKKAAKAKVEPEPEEEEETGPEEPEAEEEAPAPTPKKRRAVKVTPKKAAKKVAKKPAPKVPAAEEVSEDEDDDEEVPF